MKGTFCRSDAVHWCVECCLPDCPLLGDIGEGKIGCLGHNGKTTAEGLSERSICLSFDCLNKFSVEDKKVIREIISEMPDGKFKMSDVLIKFKSDS